MTKVYYSISRVDIGIGATKIIDVFSQSKDQAPFLDLPRHRAKHQVEFTDLGWGQMEVQNHSPYVVSLWPNQPFLGRKVYETTIVAEVVLMEDEEDGGTETVEGLRESGTLLQTEGHDDNLSED